MKNIKIKKTIGNLITVLLVIGVFSFINISKFNAQVGGGSYFVGHESQSLEYSEYYWRVKAIDENGAESDYSIPFRVIENGGLAGSLSLTPPPEESNEIFCDPSKGDCANEEVTEETVSNGVEPGSYPTPPFNPNNPNLENPSYNNPNINNSLTADQEGQGEQESAAENVGEENVEIPAEITILGQTFTSSSFAGQIVNNLNKTIKLGSNLLLEYIISPIGDIVSKAISTVGLISGIIVTLAGALFSNPIAFSEFFLAPLRLWNLLMAAFGLKRRMRPWGTVYDSVTKQPLDPAYVVLTDMNGKEAGTSITDLDGRYGFLVEPGRYKIMANKTDYKFPSEKMAGKTFDEIYQDLYFGNEIEVGQSAEVIIKNIPMDPLKFNWNEFAKNDQKLMKFFSKRELFFERLSTFIFRIGFIAAVIALIFAPRPYNAIIFALYMIMFILRKTIFKPRSFGRVEDKSGNPLSFAIVRIFSTTLNKEIMRKVCNKFGKYYCLIQNGNYHVIIEKKNEDESYSPVFTSPPFEVKKGVMEREFIV